MTNKEINELFKTESTSVFTDVIYEENKKKHILMAKAW